MCGRFAQFNPMDVLKDKFLTESVASDVSPSWNICPGQQVPAVVYHQPGKTQTDIPEGRRLGTLEWGLIPFWCKPDNPMKGLINARMETLSEKPSFKNSFRKKRCVILSDGFYEWKKESQGKTPWYFYLPSLEPFAFAGLWDSFKETDGSLRHTCTIITTAAQGKVLPVHHRMPVILSEATITDWLSPDITEPETLNLLLAEGRGAELACHPVSAVVNRPSENGPHCAKPIT